ncbi:MAG: hypothetical protein ACJZ48_00220 [Candidatus Pelagibacterales bacterium]|jgi:hypothetical protein|nr:hypothetical protein [Pelagibacteraceae bacterium]|tara:strand:- start:1181 stop:1825 length:645 start_codon:yes stop_codon:yes gene_type:complete
MDKISSLKKIFYLILISLFLYSAYWIYISFVFKNEVNNEIIRHGIQTQKIYVTGFPYRLEAHITNLSLEKEAENFFSINVPQIKISVSPFSFKKIFIQSNSSNLKYRSFTQNIDIFNKQGRLSIRIENGLIQRSTFMFEENNIIAKNIILGEFNKNFSNIILDGKVNVIDKKIEGNFQLDIYDEDKQKKFSTPVEINNNKLKILFFELDLNSLF